MTSERSGLKLAMDIALGADADEWLSGKVASEASLRTIAADISTLLGRDVSHEFVRSWIKSLGFTHESAWTEVAS